MSRVNVQNTRARPVPRKTSLALAGLVALSGVALSGVALAGVPRGVTISADEQTGDDVTGVTIARGNAELTVEKQPIHAKADVIELRPKSNEILLKGRADLTVGAERFQSDTVTCTLDFTRCLAVEPDQELPDTPGGAATSPSRGSALSPSRDAALSPSRGSATISPRKN